MFNKSHFTGTSKKRGPTLSHYNKTLKLLDVVREVEQPIPTLNPYTIIFCKTTFVLQDSATMSCVTALRCYLLASDKRVTRHFSRALKC